MIGKRNILIADDEVNLCRILDAELKKAGYAVTAVHDGAQAVEQVRSYEFQAIILDVRMPILDGLSALREIRKVSKDIPVIMMTAYESHDTMASALSMGATACVNKPFDLESLVALVKATVDEDNGKKTPSWAASVRTVLFSRHQPIMLETHGGEYVGHYRSRIEDKDDQTLTVTCFTDDGSCVTSRIGTPVSIGFAGEDAFYSFESTVLAVRDSTMMIGKPAVIYRVQRRKHPRMPVQIPIALSLVETDEESTTESHRVTACTDNIGPGGLKVIIDSRLPAGVELNINSSEIPGFDSLMVKGKVARVREVAVDGTIKWEHGIQFTKLDDETRRLLHGLVHFEGLC